jgi:hypothetical protein
LYYKLIDPIFKEKKRGRDSQLIVLPSEPLSFNIGFSTVRVVFILRTKPVLHALHPSTFTPRRQRNMLTSRFRAAARILILSFALLVFTDTTSRAATAIKEHEMPFKLIGCLRIHSNNAPIVDGNLDDACWKDAPRVTDFVKLGTEQPAALQTIVRIAHDDRNFYLAVECLDDQPDKIKADIKTRDGPVWLDDSIEVFITPHNAPILKQYPKNSRYFHFIVNPAGTQFDEIGRGIAETWNAKWKSATAFRAWPTCKSVCGLPSGG